MYNKNKNPLSNEKISKYWSQNTSSEKHIKALTCYISYYGLKLVYNKEKI